MVGTRAGTKTAKDVTNIFVNDLNCRFDNSFDGNMKLQKLLVFANLVNLVNNNEKLFNDEMSAFKNGIVVESIRKPFKEHYHLFMDSLSNNSNDFSDEEIDSIKTTIDLFYNLESSELSELHHEFDTWKKVYNRSIIDGNSHDKNKAIINYNEIEKSDLERLKTVIDLTKEEKETDSLISFNGITFYYNSNEIQLTSELINYLKEASEFEQRYGENDSFCIVTDENLGVYYY